MKKFLFFIIIITLSIILTRKEVQVKTKIISHIDTFYITDTIKIKEPVPILEVITDTLFINDTVYVECTQKTYSDSLYTAYVSGYKPKLDSIKIYQKTRYIDREIIKEIYIKPRPFSIGASVGVDVLTGSPYIGIGINYKIISF